MRRLVKYLLLNPIYLNIDLDDLLPPLKYTIPLFRKNIWNIN